MVAVVVGDSISIASIWSVLASALFPCAVFWESSAGITRPLEGTPTLSRSLSSFDALPGSSVDCGTGCAAPVQAKHEGLSRTNLTRGLQFKLPTVRERIHTFAAALATQKC